MIPQWVIEKKRDGGALLPDDIRAFIAGYTDGTIPDYQMAALAMAVYFRGMTPEETAVLTDAMMRSGDCVSFTGWPRPTADKHSTGGIGDKLSLMIGPLAASAGLAVPMISGRGLGITGGTLDKLESIPGYNARLSIPEFQRVVAEVGCSIIGQTARLAPADKKLYALRDVTGTVPSIPLITASIMSKKLAEGADTLVFDVKCGRAAFMQTLDAARELARSLLRVGRALGRRMGALITDMDQPLGRAVGNAVEVAEAVETLKGGGPADTRELTIELTALMCECAGVLGDRAAARRALAERLDDGRALEVFRRMVEAQGGDARVIDEPQRLPQPGAVLAVPALRDGIVAAVDARQIGRVVLQLGGGRTATDDVIDPAAGVDRLVQAGEAVVRGQPMMRLLARDAACAEALLPEAAAAVQIGATAPPARKLVLEEVGGNAERSTLNAQLGGRERGHDT
ncbi:MAG TPA: thymidine phosphorylase [Kiritimatiellia bacterium]|nr:thymidine phosphorylase [Kiritimatiellia bacterium]HRU69865.1 thymidine phosphorylase [Kiritimatiellia bacterium]